MIVYNVIIKNNILQLKKEIAFLFFITLGLFAEENRMF